MDLVRGETGEPSQHVPITMVVCVCGRQDTVAVCQQGSVSAVANRRYPLPGIIAWSCQEGKLFKRKTQSRWETKGSAN